MLFGIWIGCVVFVSGQDPACQTELGTDFWNVGGSVNWNGGSDAGGDYVVLSSGWIETKQTFTRPITAQAEMMANGGAECINFNLFATDHSKNTLYSFETGAWANRIRLMPGDHRETVGYNTEWATVKIELTDTHVNFYYNDELKYSRADTTRTSGTIQFVRGCTSMRMRNPLIVSGGGCKYTTAQPTTDPTQSPTSAPSDAPSHTSIAPTAAPTFSPSAAPSDDPTMDPSNAPSAAPSLAPTKPPSKAPSHAPSAAPSPFPSNYPSSAPSDAPSAAPSIAPTLAPTVAPSTSPTAVPTDAPSDAPSRAPSNYPTNAPSSDPTADPTIDPTTDPTSYPTAAPSMGPSAAPTQSPTNMPTQTGLNDTFGLTGNGGSSMLAIIIVIAFVLAFGSIVSFVVYMKMHKNMKTVERQLTAMVEESKPSAHSPQSNDATIDIGAGSPASPDEGTGGDLTVPHSGTKIGHVASDESMIMSDMMQ